MHTEVIIADATFRAEARRARNEAAGVESTLEGLIYILDMICNADMTAGNVADNFRAYTEQVRGLKGRLRDILEEEAAQTEAFIAAVDEADDYVYGDDGPRTEHDGGDHVRDFTEDTRLALISAIAESDDVEREIAGYREALYEVQSLGPSAAFAGTHIREIMEDIEEAFMQAANHLEKLVYINNTTVDQINAIWERVHELDRIYGARFAEIHGLLAAYTGTVNALSEMLNGDAARLLKTFRQPTDMFALQCGNAAKELGAREIDYAYGRMYLPNGDYDWERIKALFQSDGVKPAEAAALARLYGTMNEADMELFFAAGYVSLQPEDFGAREGRELPALVLSPVMLQVCRLFSVQTDILALALFDDEGNPRPGVTPQQAEAAQLHMLRAGIMQDVCSYGREVYSTADSPGNEDCGPVSIQQFGVTDKYGCGEIYAYEITLRHYTPFTSMYDDSSTWASKFEGTGMISAGQAEAIWGTKNFELINGLNGGEGQAAWGLAAGVGGIGLGLLDLVESLAIAPFDVAGLLIEYQQSMDNIARARGNENAFYVIQGLEALGASVRMWYNPATMQMEIRYITYDESEAYLRYQAYIDQLSPGQIRPSMEEFVQSLQRGGEETQIGEDSIFDKVLEWYRKPSCYSQVEAQEEKYESALERAKVARPDVEWPEILGGCTQEQMVILEAYL